jgi:hypothetical protein
MMKLYQFPFSHYCEKARWVLEYKPCSEPRQARLSLFACCTQRRAETLPYHCQILLLLSRVVGCSGNRMCARTRRAALRVALVEGRVDALTAQGVRSLGLHRCSIRVCCKPQHTR